MTTRKKKPAARARRSAVPTEPAPFVLAPGHALLLRTSHKGGVAYNGFRWPESGEVVAPDWNPAPVCGGGLHGYLWGDGDAESILWNEPDAVWQVVDVVLADVVNLGGKVKVPRAVVVFNGDRKTAPEFIAKFAPSGTTIIGHTATAGDGGTATAGDGGTATAGYGGTATAGYGGTATAGYGGTATAGYGGTATAGVRGTATAGDGGTISVLYYDPKRSKYRRAIAEVGEDGIEPGTAYVVDETTKKLVKKGGAK